MPLVVNEETRRPECATPLEMPERIELDGLVLRRLREGDAPASFERYASDPEVCRWLGIKQVRARVMEKAGLVRESRLRRYAINPNVSLEPTDALLYARVRD